MREEFQGPGYELTSFEVLYSPSSVIVIVLSHREAVWASYTAFLTFAWFDGVSP